MITHETDLHSQKYYEMITQWTIELNSNDILSEKLDGHMEQSDRGWHRLPLYLH